MSRRKTKPPISRGAVLSGLLALSVMSIETPADDPEGPDPLFVDSGQSLGNATTRAVAAADLDGDGDLDVFAANDGANKIWLNNGIGQFTDSGQNLGAADSSDVVLADMDNDGLIDAVVANLDAMNRVWWNEGSGIFSIGPGISSDNSRGVAVGTLDGDDLPDIYIAEDSSDLLYFNDGDRTFTDSGQSLDADFGYAVALADLDSDGDVDAYVANGGVAGAFNRVWINQGGSQGGVEGVLIDSGQELGFAWTEDVALGELDNLPGVDSFIANWFPNANEVWGNDGAAGFTDSGQSLGAEASLGVALGDVDEDSDLDAIVGNNTPDGVKLWLNDGSGGFSDSGEAIAGNTTVYEVAVADFNGDGAPDLFLGAFGPNRVWFRSDPQPVLPAIGFQPQIVDSRGDAGLSTSIALDSNGFPHIAYVVHLIRRDGRDYEVRHARWDGVRWRSERVTRMADSLIGPDAYAVDIALDSMDAPHIAVASGADPGTIQYARRDGGGWTVEDVISGGDYDARVAIALDGLDRAHLVYLDSNDSPTLYHQYFDGGMWVQEIIAQGLSSPFEAPDIAIDDADGVHISYYDDNADAIKYAHKVAGNWQSEIVDDVDPNTFDPYSAIDIDSAGNPGIAYQWGVFSEQVKLARWNGALWMTETIRDFPAPFSLGDRLGFVFDSFDVPHLAYAASATNSDYYQLAHSYFDGGQWQNRVIEQSPETGAALSLALDGNGDPHLSYYDGRHESLRYAHWGEEFEFLTVDGVAAVRATSLGVREGAPAIGFYDSSSGQVEVADWQEPWQFDGLAFSAVPIEGVSVANRSSTLHVSHYDADNQRLFYTRWDGAVENSVIVDEIGDVGAHNDITLIGGSDALVRIAYWDATNQWIRLAEVNSGAAPLLHVNDQAPGLNASSGHVAITELPAGDVGVTYYDGVNGDLRLGIWDSSANSWVDHLVAGAGSEAGRFNDVQMDGTTGVPVMAYYDETAGEVRLAHGNSPPFTDFLAAGGVIGLNSLSLSLHLGSKDHARILYTTSNGGQFLAFLEGGFWRVSVLAEPSAAIKDHTSMTLRDRMHFSFADSVGGLMYGRRMPNLEFSEPPGEPPILGDGYYNPLDACRAVLDLFLGDRSNEEGIGRPGRDQNLPDGLQGLSAPLSDDAIFEALATLFDFTAGGQFYIDLYQSHGSEMGQLALDDPILAWDAYGVLQNFMPGLEALVTGTGDDLLVDQDTVDRALDLWTRIAAAGSTELQSAINTELAKYNDLQDFVGLSYDEWANEIGVSTPAQLDNIFGDGFE